MASSARRAAADGRGENTESHTVGTDSDRVKVDPGVTAGRGKGVLEAKNPSEDVTELGNLVVRRVPVEGEDEVGGRLAAPTTSDKLGKSLHSRLPDVRLDCPDQQGRITSRTRGAGESSSTGVAAQGVLRFKDAWGALGCGVGREALYQGMQRWCPPS